jgi:hypothetical protein
LYPRTLQTCNSLPQIEESCPGAVSFDAFPSEITSFGGSATEETPVIKTSSVQRKIENRFTVLKTPLLVIRHMLMLASDSVATSKIAFFCLSSLTKI